MDFMLVYDTNERPWMINTSIIDYIEVGNQLAGTPKRATIHFSKPVKGHAELVVRRSVEDHFSVYVTNCSVRDLGMNPFSSAIRVNVDN